MKDGHEEIPLITSENDGSRNRDSANGNAAESSGTDGDSRSGSSDSGELWIGDVGNSSSRGESASVAGELFDIPLGDGSANNERSKRAAKRANGRSGGRRSSGSDSDSASRIETRTEKGATPDSDSIPREVSFESLGKTKASKSSKENASLSSEFIAEGFGLAFHGAAVLFNDDEWRLPEEDAEELATRAKKWIRQGTKNVASFEKKLARWEPLIMLILGIIAVIVPRIIHTRDKRRALRLEAQERQKQVSAGIRRDEELAPVASVQAVHSNGAAQNRGDASARNNGHSSARELPFRRQDRFEIPGLDD